MPARGFRWSKLCLLELDLGAGLLELRLDLLSLVLVDAVLDGLRSAFDQILGLFQAQARDGADFLDDLDLLVAGRSQHDRELGLLFDRSGSTTARSRGDSHG